jgi:ubiquinone/menaquinone biosynthesis C-methylase UbiE
MARETWQENLRAIEALNVGQKDRVLDVGCGHGRSLLELADRALGGKVVGVDSSELMIEIAARRNRSLIDTGCVELALASADSLPLPDNSFDKILCVHVLYFWKDLDTSLHEIARVLTPGGRLALLFRTNNDHAAIASFPAQIYRFPALIEVITALERANMEVKTGNVYASEPVLLLAEKQSA